MSAPSFVTTPHLPPAAADRFVAWVDGAGAFLLCLGETVTLGGLSGRADVRLTADLATAHAQIRRSGEGYVIDADGPAVIASDAPGRAAGGGPSRTNRACSHGSSRAVEGRTNINHNDELLLYRQDRGAVRLRFRRPNALTATATLSVVSDHRTEPRYDGIVLLAEACVFGPGSDAHLRCRDWEQTVLLFRRDGGLWCKSPATLEVNGQRADGPVRMGTADHITAPGISFRLEML